MMVETRQYDPGGIHCLAMKALSVILRTVDGDAFAIRKPPITADEEAGIIEVLRDILRDEGSFVAGDCINF